MCVMYAVLPRVFNYSCLSQRYNDNEPMVSIFSGRLENSARELLTSCFCRRASLSEKGLCASGWAMLTIAFFVPSPSIIITWCYLIGVLCMRHYLFLFFSNFNILYLWYYFINKLYMCWLFMHVCYLFYFLSAWVLCTFSIIRYYVSDYLCYDS